jgi:hypothetical protein
VIGLCFYLLCCTAIGALTGSAVRGLVVGLLLLIVAAAL